MLFRPRIFISSTFKENEQIRNTIKKLFEESGAEPLLYEKNLTPSVLPLTYRQNVLDSDFIILILKEKYGVKTNSGLSGTHEEYRIARENKVPMHVYLKEDDGSNSGQTNEEIEKFKRELESDNVSYYFYKEEQDLIQRISETIFTIAKEIMLNDILKLNLPDNDVAKLKLNKDYSKAIAIFKIIDSALTLCKYYGVDFVNTTLFMDMQEEISMYYANQDYTFIDLKLNEEFNKLYSKGSEISYELVNTTERGNFLRDYTLSNHPLSLFNNKTIGINDNIYEDIKEYWSIYEEFKKFVQLYKVSHDIEY